MSDVISPKKGGEENRTPLSMELETSQITQSAGF